jgi:DNA mismatch endonuclease (patch repair protein)
MSPPAAITSSKEGTIASLLPCRFIEGREPAVSNELLIAKHRCKMYKFASLVRPDPLEARMTDVLTPAQRRLNMSRIRGKDTKPELVLRHGLHRRGFRFRLHCRDLPGRPDLVFPRFRSVILVHGCFWHGHDCSMFKLPATRTEFWKGKIAGNRERDVHVLEALSKTGWRTLVVWECMLRGPARQPVDDVLDRIAAWLRAGQFERHLPN